MYTILEYGTSLMSNSVMIISSL